MKKLIVASVAALCWYGAAAQTDSEGFRHIFNGRDLSGWRGYLSDSIPEGWKVSEGCMFFDGEGGASEGKDLVYCDEEFSDFELRFDWKVEKGSNSGLFYLVREVEDCPIYMVAPEYQLRTDSEKRPQRRAGALYDMIPAYPQNARPDGEWNTGAVRVVNGDVTHYMNGEAVVSYSLRSSRWLELLESGKFNSKNAPKAYSLLSGLSAAGTRGMIGFQDHGSRVWLRNVRVRKLYPSSLPN